MALASPLARGRQSRERWFKRAKDAEAFRRQVESSQLYGTAIDPDRGNIRFGEYAEDWFATHRRIDGQPLAPRTKEFYRYLLDRHILPEFDRAPLASIRPERIRVWHGSVTDNVSSNQAAKAYRLLRVIFNTAVEDGRIAQSPCRVRGAGAERTKERPFVDADVVVALAEAIDPRYRAFVLLAGFGGLRLGELLALRPMDIDFDRGVVRIDLQAVELRDGTRIITGPKTDAGRRSVHLPRFVVDALTSHLLEYPPAVETDVLFTGPLSDGLRRATFYTEWNRVRRQLGLDSIHLHDLRHAAGTLAAQTGATTRELMARLGHASPNAAQRYQHAAERRDSVIAAALDVIFEALPKTVASPPVPRCQVPVPA